MDATDAGEAILVGLSSRRPARLRARRAPSRTREGRHPGRHRGDRSGPRLSLPDAAAFPGQARAVRGLGQVQSRATGWPTIPTSPSTSSATSSPSRTRPSRSRTASPGRARPTGRCWPRRSRRARSRRRSMSARRCIARSAARCWSSTATTIRSSPMRARKAVAELTGAELVTIRGRRPQSAGPLSGEVQRADHRFPRSQARHRRAEAARPAAAGQRPRRRSISPRRSASATAGATSPSRANCASSIPTWRSTGWRRTR